jgi:thioredoxin reductase (NADPH)
MAANGEEQSDVYDIAIAGGGPAGLSAALWLARYLHKVCVIDSGDPRNWETRGINGIIGSQGIRSPDLRAQGRADTAKFGAVLIDDRITVVQNVNSERFDLTLDSGGTVTARRLLLAIGIKDIWPPIPGLDRCYGETAHVCPDCDGYETRGCKTVVVGAGRKAVGMALNLTNWTDRIVICTNGEPANMTQPYLDKLAALNIPVLEARVDHIDSTNGEISCMNLEGGMQLDCERLYFAIGQYPADDLGVQLKCDRDEEGHIVVDDRFHTSVMNVFAAGDITPGPQLAIAAAAEGAIAALAIHASLVPDLRKLG